MMPYDVGDLGQHWEHQAITWTNFDLTLPYYPGDNELKAVALATKLLQWIDGIKPLPEPMLTSD